MEDLKTASIDDNWRLIPDGGFATTAGPFLYRMHEDLVEVGLETVAAHQNLSGIIHGGVIMTLVDRVIGLNCSRLRPDERRPTASLTVNFIRAARVGDKLVARCDIRRLGRKALFADAEVLVGDKLIATATGTYLKAAPAAEIRHA